VACSSNESGYVAKRASSGTGGITDADGMTGISGATGCTRDVDCRAPRVCEMGVCVSPASSGGASGASAAGGRTTDASAGGASGTGTGAAPAAAGSSGRSGDASSGSDGASSDGSAGDASNYCSLAMFIMQDRSGSMVTGQPNASPESWNNSTQAITAFVQDPSTTGIDIGLGTFPVGPNNTASCADGSDCGTPVVPIASLPGNGQAMIQAMQQQTPTPTALTPTECGLRGMINQCLKFMAASLSGEKCVAVLVTDGSPTQCDQNLTNLAQIVTDGQANGVSTFTLGLPGADLNFLNALAAAGGTDRAIDVSAGAQAFIGALNDVRTRGASQCSSNCDKKCNGACVMNGPANGCSSTACGPCPSTANGVAICSAGQCDVACLAGFEKSGTACVSIPPILPDGGVGSCNGRTCTNSCPLNPRCCTAGGACGCQLGLGLGCQ